jgi:hypothetical protein
MLEIKVVGMEGKKNDGPVGLTEFLTCEWIIMMRTSTEVCYNKTSSI